MSSVTLTTIYIALVLVGIFAMFGILGYIKELEQEKQQILRNIELQESCKVQSFYELNFNDCYKAGVKP